MVSYSKYMYINIYGCINNPFVRVDFGILSRMQAAYGRNPFLREEIRTIKDRKARGKAGKKGESLFSHATCNDMGGSFMRFCEPHTGKTKTIEICILSSFNPHYLTSFNLHPVS